MKGYFYSADSAETLAAAYPAGFETDETSGNLMPSNGLILRSTSGVWLSSPVLSEPDENGEYAVVDPGARSDAYVVISAQEIGLLGAYLIEPDGETLA